MSSPFRNHDPYDNFTRDSRNNNRNRRHNTTNGFGGNNHHYHYRDDDGRDSGDESSAMGSRVSQSNRSLASGRSGVSVASRSFATYESNSVQQASSLYHGLSQYDPNTGELYTISDDGQTTTTSSSNESQSLTYRSYEQIHHAMVYGTDEDGTRNYNRGGSVSDGGGSGSTGSGGSRQYFADESGNSDHRWIIKGQGGEHNNTVDGCDSASFLRDAGGNGDAGSRVSVSGGVNGDNQDVISMTSLSIQLSHGSRDPRKYYTPVEDEEDDEALKKVEEDNSVVAKVHGIPVATAVKAVADRNWDASNAFHASDSESCTTDTLSVVDGPAEDEQEQARRIALYNMSIAKQRRQRSKHLVCISVIGAVCTVAGIVILTVIFVPRDFQFNSGSSGTGGSNPYYGTTTNNGYGGLAPPPLYYNDKENEAASSLSIACQLQLFAQEPATSRDLTTPLTLAGQLALSRMLSDAETSDDSSAPGSNRNGAVVLPSKSPNSFLFELNRTKFEYSMQSCAGQHQASGAAPVTAVTEGRPPRVPYGSSVSEDEAKIEEPFEEEGKGSDSDVVSSYVSPLSQLANIKHPNVTMELKLHPGRPPIIFDLSLLKESLTASSSPLSPGSNIEEERKYGVYAKIERIASEVSPVAGSSAGAEKPEVGEDALPGDGAYPGQLDAATAVEVGGVEEVNLIMNGRGTVTGSAHMGGSIYYISTLEDGSQLVEAVALDTLPADDAGEPYLAHPSEDNDDDDDEDEPENLRRRISTNKQSHLQGHRRQSSFRSSRALEDVPMPTADIAEKEEAVVDAAATEVDELTADEEISFIDVLVPYTSRAFCSIVKAPEEMQCEVTEFRLEQVHQRIELMIFEANVALEQSGISGKQFRLAHAFLVDEDDDEVFDERSNGWDYADLLRMAAVYTDGWLLNIHNARNAYGGDVVAFLVDHQGQCGLAYGGFPVSEKWAYCVVNYMCATGYYSFAHEVAHLLGARHDRPAEQCPLEGLLTENDALLNGEESEAVVTGNGSSVTVQSIIADLETQVVPVASADASFVGSNGESGIIGGNNKRRPSSSTGNNENFEDQENEEEDAEEEEELEEANIDTSTETTEITSSSAAEEIAHEVEEAMTKTSTSSDINEDLDLTEVSGSKIGLDVIQRLNQSGGCCGSGQKPCDGFGFQDIWGRYRTVMAYRCPTRNCPRIQMFSQPYHDYEVKFTTWVVHEEESKGESSGASTDVGETRAESKPTKYVPVTNIYKYKVGHELYNNARQIASTWDIVANYRQPPKREQEQESSFEEVEEETDSEEIIDEMDDRDEEEDFDEVSSNGNSADDGSYQLLEVPGPVLPDSSSQDLATLDGAAAVAKELDLVEARGNQHR